MSIFNKKPSKQSAFGVLFAVATLGTCAFLAKSSNSTRAENIKEATPTAQDLKEQDIADTNDILAEARENTDSLDLEAQRAYIEQGYNKEASDQDIDNYNDAYNILTKKIDSVKQVSAKLILN